MQLLSVTYPYLNWDPLGLFSTLGAEQVIYTGKLMFKKQPSDGERRIMSTLTHDKRWPGMFSGCEQKSLTFCCCHRKAVANEIHYRNYCLLIQRSGSALFWTKRRAQHRAIQRRICHGSCPLAITSNFNQLENSKVLRSWDRSSHHLCLRSHLLLQWLPEAGLAS